MSVFIGKVKVMSVRLCELVEKTLDLNDSRYQGASKDFLKWYHDNGGTKATPAVFQFFGKCSGDLAHNRRIVPA